MTIDRIHQEIKARWNKLNSNHKPDFSPAYLDDCINKAQEDYVDIFYSGNNSKQYKFGFEVTQARMDMLQSLVRTYAGAVTTAGGKYYTLLSAVPAYRYFVRGSLLVTGCTERVPLTIVRLNDLDGRLKDANVKPSKRWNRALANIADSKINYYADGVSTDVELHYIKNPVKVFSGGYDTLEFLFGDLSAYSTSSLKVTSEIDESFHDILVDMTVQYIAKIFEDQLKYSLQERDTLNKI